MVIFHSYVSNKKTTSGWWLTYPSEKYESVGMMKFPIYGKIKNVPNHQPDIEYTFSNSRSGHLSS